MDYYEKKIIREPIPQNIDATAKAIVDSAFMVHSYMGPGLLESIYEVCLAYELRERGHLVESQAVLPVSYKNLKIDSGLRLDLLVDGCVIVELKAVNTILPIHEAQILSYLKLTGRRVGLLINFKTHLLKD